MTTTTAEQLHPFPDPTESFEFKAFILLDTIVARVKLRVLIELTKLRDTKIAACTKYRKADRPLRADDKTTVQRF